MTSAFTGEGKRMERAESEAFLRERGTGVLSLAADDEAYSIPISFGYDGETIYVVFQGYSADSEKSRFVEETGRACLVTYDVAEKFEWTSVLVRGSIREVDDDEWDDLVEAIEDNAWYPSLFSEADPRGRLRGFALSVEEISGLEDDSAV